MISKLQNPVIATVLSLVLSVSVGVALCWRASRPLIELAMASRAKVVPSKKENGWDFWTIEVENLSNDLKEERARLRNQAELLDQRAARIDAEEKELAGVRAGIEALKRQIDDKVTEISADEAKNIRTLAQTYTNLSPRAAVAILKELDDTTAVKILSQMKPDIVGPIFEEMSRGTDNDSPLARRAAVLSERLRLMKSNRPSSPG
jgi:flagellar motility protein MotE (MotC chaperone)